MFWLQSGTSYLNLVTQRTFRENSPKFAIFQGKKPLKLPYLLDIARFWANKFWKSPNLDYIKD